MYFDTDRDNVIERNFDKIAGAAFALGWLNSFVPTPSGINAPIFGWLLSMNALAASDLTSHMVAQLVTDFDTLVVAPTAFDPDVGQQFRTDLDVAAQHEWSFWLPLLLFSPTTQRELHWSNYQTHFPAATQEERALRQLLFNFLDDPQRDLMFTPDSNSYYSSLAETVIIRVGNHLKELKTTVDDAQQQIFTRWHSFTRKALKHVHSGLRLSRRLCPDASECIDLLLALLAVAEWRAQPDIWRIPTFIESYKQYREEALTARQIALSSVLFGYFEGYHRVAAGVQQLPLRRLLAGQVMALVSAPYSPEEMNKPSFYLPSNASAPNANWIITDEIESESTLHRRWSQKGGAEPDIARSYQTLIRIVVPELDVRFSYDFRRGLSASAMSSI